jgi:hypothetical protein
MVFVTHWLTHWPSISDSAIMPGHSNEYRGVEKFVVSMDIGTVYSENSHTEHSAAADPFSISSRGVIRPPLPRGTDPRSIGWIYSRLFFWG